MLPFLAFRKATFLLLAQSPFPSHNHNDGIVSPLVERNQPRFADTEARTGDGAQSSVRQKLQGANIDPLAQEAKSSNTTSTTTVKDEHPEIAKAEKEEEKKIEKLEEQAQPTG